MFPVSDVIPSRATPAVTVALGAAIALGFAYQVQLERYELELLAQRLGVVPAAFTWTQVLPSMFLHAGWLHVSLNLLFLWLFGANVEDRLGRLRYLLFYAGCGFAAALAHATVEVNSTVPAVGASGAVAGVMGAYVVLYPQSRVLTAVFAIVLFDIVELPAVFYVALWFVGHLFVDIGSLGVRTASSSGAFAGPVCAFLVGALTGVYLRLRKHALRAYWEVERSSAG